MSSGISKYEDMLEIIWLRGYSMSRYSSPVTIPDIFYDLKEIRDEKFAIRRTTRHISRQNEKHSCILIWHTVNQSLRIRDKRSYEAADAWKAVTEDAAEEERSRRSHTNVFLDVSQSGLQAVVWLCSFRQYVREWAYESWADDYFGGLRPGFFGISGFTLSEAGIRRTMQRTNAAAARAEYGAQSNSDKPSA